VTHEKGVLRARLVANGHNAHSAYPWLGRNAIDMLFADISRLKEVGNWLLM
jgi:acetylornithine deacetylase/succinyl-diaminopimelate desuccinylase-like protein